LAPLRELEDRSLLSVTPVGAEVKVNTFTQNAQQTSQQTHAVAMNPTTGDYVVVWSSKHQNSTDTWDVYFQRYNAAGVPQGAETLVSAHVDGVNQQFASVAMNASGNFVVTWSSNALGKFNVYAQQFNSGGVAQGGVIQVSTPTSDDQENSTVAIDQNGNFVITSSGHQGGDWNVYAEAFNAAGAPTTGVFAVNTPVAGKDQMFSDVAMNASGNFVITWSGHQTSKWSVYAQQYSVGATTIGSTIQVNTNITDDQEYSSAAIDASGNFIITWSGHQNGHWNIYAQTYKSSGTPVSSNFQVNPNTNKDQQYSAVAYGNTANPIITWQSKDQDGNGWGVFAQQVTPTGTAVGSEIQVNTYTHDDQQFANIAGGQSANVVIVWASNKQDGNNFGVYGQRLTTGISTADISVAPTNLVTSETGTSASFSVSLTSAPTAPVTINLADGDPTQGTLSQSTLTFTTANWNIAQAVTVTGLDDHIVQGDQTYQIAGTATSSDANYNNLAMTPVIVTNTEADVAGYSITPTSITTSETGTTASFSIALSSKPLAPVTVNLTNGDPTQGLLSQSSLTFDDTNWNIAQTVNVTGLDDHIVQGDQTYQITGAATSTDVVYNGLAITPISVTNTEADVAGFTVTPTSIQTSMAGASASFDVVLTSQPVAPVTINLSSSNPSEGSLSQSSLTFDASNWNVVQTVTITGQNDLLALGDVSYQITGAAVSTDGAYNGQSMTPVDVTNKYVLSAGFVVTPTTLTTSETGTSASFSVVLTSLPLGTVTVNLTNGDPTQGSLSTSTLTFSTLNWNIPQTVTVTGLDDHIVHGNQTYQITGTAASLLDLSYNGLTLTPVTVTNTEADVAGFTVAPGSITTSESGTSASFSVALRSQPIGTVTINLTNGNPVEGSLSAGVLTFDATNWSIAQTVTVTGLDDHIVQGNQTYQVTGTATSSDGSYNNLAMSPVSITNTEADTVGFTVTPTGLTTSESGASASFSVALTSQPQAPVTITLQPTDPSQGSLSQSVLTFDASTWNVAQSVTVTGLNSYMTTPSVAYQITGSASSADVNYNGLSTTPVDVTNTVAPNAAGTTVVVSSSPAVYGQSITFTATVSGVAPMTGTPTGSVTFLDGSTNLATVALSSGSATFTTATFAAGNHNITVTYAGDTYFSANTSNALAETVNPATLTITVSAQSKLVGQPDPALTYSAVGFQLGDTAATVLTGALNRNAGENVGSFAITQGTLAANSNYSVNYVGNNLTITSATVPVPPATPTVVPLTPSTPSVPSTVPTSMIGLLASAPPTVTGAPNQNQNGTTTAASGAQRATASLARMQTLTADAAQAIASGTPLQLQRPMTNRTVEQFAPIPRASWQESGSMQVVTWMPTDDEARFEAVPVSTLATVGSPTSTVAEQADVVLDILSETGERIPWTDGARETTALVGAGALATTGYVMLNTRLGVWLLSLLTSQPLWKQFDPLEVLYAWEEDAQEEAKNNTDDDETLVTLVDEW
jgi:hypothetical protein